MDTAQRALRLLAPQRGGESRAGAGPLESSGAPAGPPGERDIAAIALMLKRARASDEGPGSADLDRLAASLVERAGAVVQRLAQGAALSSLDAGDQAALESVIRTRGRPALAIEGPRVEPIDDQRHPGSGFWRTFVNDYEDNLLQVSTATAAVLVRDTLSDGPPIVCGTAWLAGNGVMVTNRHVILPPDPPRPVKRVDGDSMGASIKAGYEITVDFARDDGPARDRTSPVTGVPFVSAERDPVDIAVLRIAAVPDGASPLALGVRAPASKMVYVFGHPGPVPAVSSDVQAVFGTPNGRKRVSFGVRMADDPAYPGEWTHDASTIGGFSGGCVLTFADLTVAALHYYGQPASGNRAIPATRLREHAAYQFF